MSIIPINKENIADYSDLVDGDVAENIGRMYYRGVAVHDPDDNSPLSLLIWELKSVEAAGDTESELKWLYAADPSFILPLFDEYSSEALSEDVKRTALEMAVSDTEKSDAMIECGFTFSPVESRYLNVSVTDFTELSFMKKKAPSYITSIGDLNDRAKTMIMSYLSVGKNQITLANYQTTKEGYDELVISDLNGVRTPKVKSPMADWTVNDRRGNERLIQISRKDREKRFSEIARYMANRRQRQGGQDKKN
ncbi:MAG: hypothetical protein K6B72_02570 [Lachnospiraceae bacterium]|nr:hypothetical protein [Lachnospiraceae bacterium]